LSGRGKPRIIIGMDNRKVRYTVMAFLAVFVLIATAASSFASERITAGELKAMLDAGEPVVLIDVRTPSEHITGHIPGSVLMPLDTLEGVDKLPEGGRAVVYCHSGRRSLRAMEIFKAKGFTGLVDLEGGIEAWKAAGGRVETGR